MPIEDVLNDLKAVQKRAKSATHLNAKEELGANTYPLLSDALEAIVERFQVVEEQVAELIAQTESLIQPELADEIDETLRLGVELCDLLGRTLDPMPDILRVAIDKFRASADATARAVAEVSLEEEEEDEEGEEGEGDDEANEADDVGVPPVAGTKPVIDAEVK